MMLVYLFLIVLLAAWLLWRGRPSTLKAMAFALFAALGIAAAADSLGTPKPFWLEWRDEVVVVAAQYYPNKAIYIWIKGPDPVAYRLPWNEKQAEELQRSLRKAKREGERGVVWRRQRPYGEAPIAPIPAFPNLEKQ